MINNWGDNRKKELHSVIKNKYIVINSNHSVALHYALIVSEMRRIGHPISENDAWISACALAYDIPLLTANKKDFSEIHGLILL